MNPLDLLKQDLDRLQGGGPDLSRVNRNSLQSRNFNQQVPVTPGRTSTGAAGGLTLPNGQPFTPGEPPTGSAAWRAAQGIGDAPPMATTVASAAPDPVLSTGSSQANTQVILGPFMSALQAGGADFQMSDLSVPIFQNIDRALALIDDPTTANEGVAMLNGSLNFLDKLADNIRADARGAAGGGGAGSAIAMAQLALQQAGFVREGEWRKEDQDYRAGRDTVLDTRYADEQAEKSKRANEALQMKFLEQLGASAGGFAAPGSEYLGGAEPNGALDVLSQRAGLPFSGIKAPPLPTASQIQAITPEAIRGNPVMAMMGAR